MPTLSALALSFARSQRAEGKSPFTIRLYRHCLGRLIRHLDDDVSRLTRRELSDYYGIRAETVKPSSVGVEFRCHRRFISWLIDEDEISGPHPMAKMRPPRTPIVPVPVLTEDEVSRLLAACNGKTTRDIRDRCLITFARRQGGRLGEMALLTTDQIDLDRNLVTLTAKGRTRVVPLDPRTVVTLDRWLRRRGDHPGSLFGLSRSGLHQAFKRRARMAGLDVHIHQLRHTFASAALSDGISETDLMSLAGWSSRKMLDRYGASQRSQRAITAYRRLYG